MLSEQAQQDVSAVGGGFAARKDIEADPNATELAALMDGVEIFEPDWSDIGTHLDDYVDAWRSATGS